MSSPFSQHHYHLPPNIHTELATPCSSYTAQLAHHCHAFHPDHVNRAVAHALSSTWRQSIPLLYLEHSFFLKKKRPNSHVTALWTPLDPQTPLHRIISFFPVFPLSLGSIVALATSGYHCYQYPPALVMSSLKVGLCWAQSLAWGHTQSLLVVSGWLNESINNIKIFFWYAWINPEWCR